ncbi:GrpE-domain-containing protein [Hypomontagnella monticulosa]|nr:GrpE-domain-containing protein [Hypomontagnella monticulosa]
MLKQVISRSSRAVYSGSRTVAQRPLLRSQFSPAPLSSIQSQLLPSTRWYSGQAESAAKKEGEGPTSQAEAQAGEAQAGEAAKSSNVEAELKKKLEAKEKEVLEWKDKYLRSVADFRNLQDRTQRDMKAARDFAIQKFAKDLVDSVDNLDRALTMGQEKIKTKEEEEKNEDLMNFYEGVKMTETNMLQTLAKHGLERFDPNGEKFNPNEHEATFMTPMPDKEDNTVFHVQQKGFKLNGRVLRAAKVGVAKSQ